RRVKGVGVEQPPGSGHERVGAAGEGPDDQVEVRDDERALRGEVGRMGRHEARQRPEPPQSERRVGNEGEKGLDATHGGPCSNFREAGIPFAVRSSLWLPIAVAAALLRCWRLSWGLFDGGWFPDEGVFSARAAAFVPLSAASFGLRADDFGYPTLYGYLSGAALAATHGLGLLPLPVRPYAPDVILVARCLSAAASVATVVVVAILGRPLYGPGVAAVAAALVAVAPLSAMHAHIAATDSLLAAFVALTTLAAYALATRGGAWRPLGAGLPFGLGWPLAVVALAGVVVALRRHELADRIVLAALLPYFLVIGSSRVTFSRYLLPLFPGLLLLAARALCDLPRAPRAAL